MEELQTWILAQQTIDKGFLLSEKSEFKSKKKKKKRTDEEGKAETIIVSYKMHRKYLSFPSS